MGRGIKKSMLALLFSFLLAISGIKPKTAHLLVEPFSTKLHCQLGKQIVLTSLDSDKSDTSRPQEVVVDEVMPRTTVKVQHRGQSQSHE